MDIKLKKLKVRAGVRYWEDASVNSKEDVKGDLIPCREGDYWCPEIDLKSGVIINWEKGKKADIHYKVCDDGLYKLYDDKENCLSVIDGYVPTIMCPERNGYGDYIIMQVDENGKIKNYKKIFDDFKFRFKF